ncbi:N-acetylmuramoyl-L-alanine amidase [Acerihabitans arboris]|uniref:N-acetylmuramoyl-L-alanine amidase n=1 Tax=Acerihabitans arboris TaxID=2691583 RepID=A0A845SH88_9GAMM|nr:N-acetylmuramoyl-L-alanine amidase [Acerihabitans arboris]NDL62677.1 N-acetylmuramoyl-L-alanine amidase [Acerihabitans arboris]
MKRISLASKSLALAILLAGCADTSRLTDRGGYRVDTSVSSLNQNARVRYLVMHYTAVNDRRSLELLTRGAGSAHYLAPSVPRVVNGKPVVLRLVPEEKRAWHAGISEWNGRSNLNDTSVGIEIVNPGFTVEAGGRRWHPFSPNQIELVALLAEDIIRRHQISPDNVVAHSDIAPLRKSDPGPLFPWEQLAGRGIGAWPDRPVVDKYLAGRAPDAPVPVLNLQRALAKYGYSLPQHGGVDDETTRVVSAFQMHFRPGDISGRADAETEAIAMALLEKYRT